MSLDSANHTVTTQCTFGPHWQTWAREHQLSREHHLYQEMAPKQQEGRGVRRVVLLQAVPPAAAWGPAEEPAEVRARPGAHTAPSLWVLQSAPAEAPSPGSI